MASLYSTELNALILQYLQESGYTRTAFQLESETRMDKSPTDSKSVPLRALISLVQKGLQLLEMEPRLDCLKLEDVSVLPTIRLLTKSPQELYQMVVSKSPQEKESFADEGSSWAEFPKDMLIDIFEELSYCALTQVAEVCKEWSEAATTTLRIYQPILLSVEECLSTFGKQIIIHTLGEGNPRKELSKVVIPRIGRPCQWVCVGSSKDTAVLIQSGDEDKLVLIKLLSGVCEYIKYPDLFNLGLLHVEGLIPSRSVVLAEKEKKRDPILVLGMKCVYSSCLLYYQYGIWAVLYMGYNMEDLLALGSMMYAISSSGSVKVWSFNLSSCEPPALVFHYSPNDALPFVTMRHGWKNHEDQNLHYIVRSERELLFVRRADFQATMDIHPQIQRWDFYTHFEVYHCSLNLGSDTKWERLHSLGDRALFLGINESVALPGRFLPHGCSTNAIYYTGDNRAPITLFNMPTQVFDMESRISRSFQEMVEEHGMPAKPFWYLKCK